MGNLSDADPKASASRRVQKQVLDVVQRARDDAAAWDKKIAALRAKLKDCTHLFTEDYEWEHDNGYGKQEKLKGLRCKACLRVNYWPGMSQQWMGGES